ncbi:replication-associated protein [Crucivirus-323]|nr:replication-associated protein [Crucivirus-322]QMW68801.1 replication-associated protein [Crucivirus-323]QMW68803.1 replication-associated protein [Crucivirus-324]
MSTARRISSVRSRGRSWCFTLNNPVDSDYGILEDVGAISRYLIYGKEHFSSCSSDSTPHLQGYVMFENPKEFNTVKSLLGSRCHLEVARGTPQDNIDYCSKGNQPKKEWEDLGVLGPNYGVGVDITSFGIPPMTQKRKGEKGGLAQKEKWAKIRKLADEGNLDEIGENEPKVYVTHYRTLKQIAVDHLSKPANLESPAAIWCCGVTGVGKSTKYRSLFPDAYVKNHSKWWDGYQGQDIVILEDISKFHVKLGDLMKLWSDKWSFICEYKGGSRWIRPKLFIVTSQYTIEGIWDDEETRTALKRRFRYDFMSDIDGYSADPISESDGIFVPFLGGGFLPNPLDDISRVPETPPFGAQPLMTPSPLHEVFSPINLDDLDILDLEL